MAEIYRPQKFAGIKIARFTRDGLQSRDSEFLVIRIPENHFTVIPLIRLHLRDLFRVSRLASSDFSKIGGVRRDTSRGTSPRAKECIVNVTRGIVSRRCAQLRRAA